MKLISSDSNTELKYIHLKDLLLQVKCVKGPTLRGRQLDMCIAGPVAKWMARDCSWTCSALMQFHCHWSNKSQEETLQIELLGLNRQLAIEDEQMRVVLAHDSTTEAFRQSRRCCQMSRQSSAVLSALYNSTASAAPPLDSLCFGVASVAVENARLVYSLRVHQISESLLLTK